MKTLKDLWPAAMATFTSSFAFRSFLLAQESEICLPMVGSMLPLKRVRLHPWAHGTPSQQEYASLE